MPHPDPVPSAEPGAGPLSIGELAARSGLSPKALRMYDESGLLPPRRVDPFTGYRSYGPDQVARARLIAALRGVGIRLARIQALCDLEPQAAAWELRSWWRQEQADALSRAAALDGGAVRPSQQDAVLARTLIQGDRLACAHIGDTRALVLRGERIDPITQDHTRVRSLPAAGRLSPEEAAGHPERAVLNRALAAGAPTAPDLLLRTLEPGDTVVVLSDGIHAVLDPTTLANALAGEVDDAAQLAARLVDAALAAGGRTTRELPSHC